METRPQPGFPATLLVHDLIDGVERPSEGPLRERRSPFRRSDVVTVSPDSSAARVREALSCARGAFASWSREPAPRRARVLAEAARLLTLEKEQLARFLTREVGKPLREARGDVQEAIDTAEFFLSEGRRLYGQTVPSELPNKELSTHRRPLGVVGMITAGNFPIAVPAWKLFPALLCGNVVVWKPSEDAPGCAALLADLLVRAGLPRGVLSVVHGGASTGAALVAEVEHGGVDKIAFTGSTAVGREIGAICGRALQIPTLELGGKNPLVVLADADLELAVDGAIWASFGTAGQRCTSAGNLIVDRRILPAFRELFVARAKALVIGDPRRPEVDYGPLIDERFAQRWQAQRAIGLDESAELLLDGRRIVAGQEPPQFVGDATDGLYVTPRIFDRVTPSMRIAQEECFGPTVNLLEVDGLVAAIAAANASPYGLSSAIYTRDARAAHRFREEIRAGMTSINNSTTGAEAHLPFGGVGWSGNGTRESGIWVLDAYTYWHAVNVDHSGRLQKAQIDLPEERAARSLDLAPIVDDTAPEPAPVSRRG